MFGLFPVTSRRREKWRKPLILLDILGIIPDRNHEKIRHTSLKNPVPIIRPLSSKFKHKSDIDQAIIAAFGAAVRGDESGKIRQRIKQYSFVVLLVILGSSNAREMGRDDKRKVPERR